jgi:putative ABC transport system permease protein
LSIESILVALISFVIALALCLIFQPRFNLVVEKNLSLWTFENIKLMAMTLLLVIVISLISIARRNSENRFRNLLVGLQVGFSFVLLAFSFIVAGQIDFFKNKDLGFDKSNVIVIKIFEELDHDALRQELKRNASVIDVSEAEPPGHGYNGWRFVPEDGSYEKPIMLPFTFADEDFLSTMRIKLLSGRNFSKPNEKDTIWPFLINKRAAIELGWSDNAIGRRMKVFQAGRTEIMGEGEVIGIIDDYHSESLHDPIKPVVICAPSYAGIMLTRVTSINGETIDAIETTWKKFGKKPLRYEVLEEQLETLYANEEKLANVMLFFTFVALYLTCYGMFAMSSLLFSSKLKEVAIRKVLGAGEGSIMRHFYGRYALFNVIALVAGLPVAIWLGNLWLETFPYRIELSLLFFVKAALLILAAGILSVSYYLVRVTWSNPLPFLRRD